MVKALMNARHQDSHYDWLSGIKKEYKLEAAEESISS